MDIVALGIGIGVVGIIGVAIAINSIVFVRPKTRALIERFGKYNRFVESGMVFVIPFIERAIIVDITEGMVNAEQQEVITKDSLNAMVDAQIYFKVKPDEASVKKSQYAVADFEYQIVQLARTTLRSIIGTMTLTEANSERNMINKNLRDELEDQVEDWGIQIVRAELQEITPPSNVQGVMNEVVVAEKKKVAAKDFAAARNIEADGERQAAIQSAEGSKKAATLRAEGEASAISTIAHAEAERIRLVSESSKKNFTGQAVQLRQIEMAEKVLSNNTKFIIPAGGSLINVLGDAVNTPIILPGKKTTTQSDKE